MSRPRFQKPHVPKGATEMLYRPTDQDTGLFFKAIEEVLSGRATRIDTRIKIGVLNCEARIYRMSPFVSRIDIVPVRKPSTEAPKQELIP